MFDTDTLMEIYCYLVELRTIKKKLVQLEMVYGVGAADFADIDRLDDLLKSFSDFFEEVYYA